MILNREEEEDEEEQKKPAEQMCFDFPRAPPPPGSCSLEDGGNPSHLWIRGKSMEVISYLCIPALLVVRVIYRLKHRHLCASSSKYVTSHFYFTTELWEFK